MKNKLILFLAILLVPMLLFAQSASGGRSRGTSTFQLTVTANISASVTITNPAIKGFTALNGNTTFVQALVPGKYTVKVSAEGYIAQTKTVNLTENQTVNFQLQPALVRLKVTSNVHGASVQVSGAGTASGNIPFQKNLTLGNYTVSISANGYESQSRAVNLQSAQNIHFNLKTAMGTLQVVISPDSLNKRDIYAREKILIIDNGIEMDGMNFQLRPGQHTIQIISGGLWTQTTINVEAGKTYTIQPTLSLEIYE